jgi:hypothetical protein
MAKTVAVLSGATVTNIIVVGDDIEQAEQDLGLTLVEYTSENPAAVGYIYDGEKFIAPVVEEITE